MRVLAPAALLLALSGTISAQDQMRGNFFVGYSFVNGDLGSRSKIGFHGYEVSSDFNPLPWLAVTMDDDGHFGSGPVPFCLGTAANTCTTSGPPAFSQLYTFSGGVRLSAPKGRLRPFVRALFGLATLDACPIQGCESKGAFTQAYGAGVDLRISERRIGWRFQGDFLQTRFFGTTQNDSRFSTGLIIFFYKHSH